jgi:hypothetical protein
MLIYLCPLNICGIKFSKEKMSLRDRKGIMNRKKEEVYIPS